MGVYNSIRDTRKILDRNYDRLTHEQSRRMLGVSKNLYERLRYYNTVTVAQEITPEIQARLDDFIALHKQNDQPPDPEPVEEIEAEEKIKPKEPVEVFVNNDVENPSNLQLRGKALDMVNAMAKLREAMQPFWDMGYHVGVTLYRKKEEDL